MHCGWWSAMVIQLPVFSGFYVRTYLSLNVPDFTLQIRAGGNIARYFLASVSNCGRISITYFLANLGH